MISAINVARGILYCGAAAGIIIQCGMSVWSGLHSGHWDGSQFALSFASTLAAAGGVILAHEGRIKGIANDRNPSQ